MSAWLLLFVLPALADDAEEEPVSEEITVIGDAVEQARAEVVREVHALGYTIRKEKDDRTVLRNERSYRGKVVLYDDGRIETHRTGLHGRKIEPIRGSRVRPYFLCLIQPTFCVDPGSWYVAPARWRAYEDEVIDETAASMRTWSDRLADEAFAGRVGEMGAALEALWERGEPLEPGAPALATAGERRAALLAFWDSRTDTAWGAQMRQLVAGFVRAVVETSDTPYSDAEKAAFEGSRESATPFPWVVVDAVDGALAVPAIE